MRASSRRDSSPNVEVFEQSSSEESLQGDKEMR